jgi:intein-encoded DNA endonuclease-like protein
MVAHRQSILHPEKIYENVMSYHDLVKRERISVSEVSRKVGIPRSTVHGWYVGRQPAYKLIGPGGTLFKKISESSKKMSPEKAYVLGVICGDGYVSYKDKYVMLETIDRLFINEFRRCLISVYGNIFAGTVKPTCNGKQRIVICGSMMTEDIRRYLPEQGSHEWRVPADIDNSNSACRASFVRGFFDSEGSVHKRHSMEIISTNLVALHQVADLIGSLDIKCGNITRGKNYYRLNISGMKNIVRFIEVVGTNIPRKAEKMNYLLSIYGVN